MRLDDPLLVGIVVRRGARGHSGGARGLRAVR
jgi:hypothetical protein